MAKLTLTDPTSNYRSTVQIMDNNTATEAALENTLSRDGTGPNAMGATLDMGTNQVINVVDPSNAQDAATKGYVDGLVTTIADINVITQADGKIIVSDGTNWVGESGATARTSLGVAIGSDVQAHDADLDAIAAITQADGKVIVSDGTNWVGESGATARTSLGVAIGSDVQAHSSLLDTYATGVIGTQVFTGFTSIAILTALAKPSTDGAVAFVLGYLSSGDGGGGKYVWDASATDTDITGVIESADSGGTGRWILQHTGIIDIRVSGALCDGSTDDSGAIAAVMSSGANPWFPSHKTTVIGSGTAIKFLTSFQSWVTAASTTFDTYLKIGAQIQMGNDVTGSEALIQGIGLSSGFYIEDTRTSPSGGLFKINYVNTAAFGRGRAVNVHQFLELGDASATGPAYRIRNEMDLNQRAGTVTVVDGTSFAAAETITGGTSGATALISSIDGNVLTVSLSSETAFSASEAITGDVAGSSTFSSQYRPDHMFKCLNFAGAFISDATVEGAFDGASDGFHADSNTYTRVDEAVIREYFGRFRKNFSAVDARVVNCWFEADMEGALEASIMLHVTSSTSKAVSAVGWSDIYFKSVKLNTAAPDLVGQAGVWIQCNRSGVECETIDGHISLANQHGGHGIFIRAQAGEIKGVNLRLTGVLTPRAAATYSAIRATEDGGATLSGLRIAADIHQEGANSLVAVYNLEGAMQVEMAPPVYSGTITNPVVFAGTPDYTTVNGQQVLRGTGSVSAPSYSFAEDMDTGFYLDGSGNLSASLGGTQQFYIRSGGAIVANGTAATPGFGFIGDPSTGIFRDGSGDVAITAAGTSVASFPSTGMELPSGNSLKHNGSVRIAEDGGVVIVSANSTNIASATAAINTTGKHQGKLVWNTSDTSIYTAAGSSATSTWWPSDTSLSSVTPS